VLRTLTRRPAAAVLIVLMVIGSLAMWIVNPIFWLWLASQLQKNSQPSLGPYLVVLVGILVTMAVLGKVLGRLNRLYGDVTGTTPTVRWRAPWHRSLRDEREGGAPHTVLNTVMVVSVSVAVLVFGIWFFFFAGSSLPT
jgi:hypothetical protein